MHKQLKTKGFVFESVEEGLEVEQDGRRARLRTAPGPTIDPICRALGIALPPVFQEIPPAPEPA